MKVLVALSPPAPNSGRPFGPAPVSLQDAQDCDHWTVQPGGALDLVDAGGALLKTYAPGYWLSVQPAPSP